MGEEILAHENKKTRGLTNVYSLIVVVKHVSYCFSNNVDFAEYH